MAFRPAATVASLRQTRSWTRTRYSRVCPSLPGQAKQLLAFEHCTHFRFLVICLFRLTSVSDTYIYICYDTNDLGINKMPKDFYPQQLRIADVVGKRSWLQYCGIFHIHAYAAKCDYII